MKTCNECNMRLWSTDKGVCPTCKPEENRAVYGLAPLAKVVEQVREPRKILIQKVSDPTTETCCTMSETLADVVKAHVLTVYEQNKRNKARAAKVLGITTKTLYNHLDRYGVV